ncbi:DUF4432 family protein [Tessaracoccus sp. Z1128]
MSQTKPSEVHLRPEMFRTHEETLLRCSSGMVSTFRYPSGVEALRLTTDRVELIVLPFRGQQIWRLFVDGEDVTMKTHFDEPTPSTVFEESYGGFLLHCGGTGVGHPGAEDTHALHGELPTARYDSASVLFAEGEEPWLGVTGSCRLRRTHSMDIEFRPLVRVRPRETQIEIDATLTNHRIAPFDYSYMCHVNFPLFDDARLEQTVSFDASHFTVVPDANQDSETEAYTRRIIESPEESNHLSLSQPLVPEYCAVIRPHSGEDGWAHFLQVRPAGDAAFVSFDTATLPMVVRWISNTGDEAAAGFCLPSTTHHRGRAASKRDGLLSTVDGSASVSMRVVTGLLSETPAKHLRARITQINERAVAGADPSTGSAD